MVNDQRQTCSNCNGMGTRQCTYCKGTGVNRCTKCEGTGSLVYYINVLLPQWSHG